MESVHIKLLLLAALFAVIRLALTFSALTDAKAKAKICDLCDMGMIASVVTLVLITFAFRLTRVQGESMLPSLHDGEFTIVNQLIYRLHPPQRGDIIVFRSPVEEGEDYIKRVVALPGETLSIESGWVIVKGLKLNEPYVLNAPDHSFSQTTVPPDHLFVLGDNRQNSSDSRNYDAIPYSSILGKASFVIWPPHDWGFIKSFRGRRFLSLSSR
jgi:signal peptidase I